MRLRTLIFWPHLVAGILAAAVILVMSVTGVLLTYERQLIAWSDSHFRSAVPAAGAARLPLEQLIEIGRQASPGASPSGITISSEPDAPVGIAVPQRTIYVDAYSGVVLGEGSQAVRRVMSELRAWHRWLAATDDSRPAARAITGWSNLVFLLLILSGMYLWLPKVWSWAQVRAIAIFKAGATGKARDFNWHNVIGIWSAIPLAIVVASAVPISFPWANAAIYQAVGEPVPAGRGGGGRPAEQAAPGRRGGAAGSAVDRRGAGRDAGEAMPRATAGGARTANRVGDSREAGDSDADASTRGLDALFARAARRVPGWRTINVRMPPSAADPVTFAIDRGDGGQPQLRSTLTLTRGGEVASFEDFSSLTLGRRIRNVMRFAHTGEVLGIPGQTVAGLVSLGGVVLVWTGVALALRRFSAWLRRKSRRSTSVTPTVSSAA
jgi:uncharacterized iron-regulated membrane protein